MNKKIFLPVVLIFIFVIFIGMSLYSEAAQGNLPSFENTWTCDNNNGFTSEPDSQYCYKEGCMAENQLLMCGANRTDQCLDSYYLTFESTLGNYTCNVTVITNHFDFKCAPPPYGPQPDEKTDVFLNEKKLGTTPDPYCNTWDDCPEDGNGDGNGDGATCHEYSKKGVSVCSQQPGCCWIYGAGGIEKCGPVALCENKGVHLCKLRICYPSSNGCKCLKEEGEAWVKGCSKWNNDKATCNDYSKHKGIVCCYDVSKSKCITDPCPVWYKSRVHAIYDNMKDAGMSVEEAIEDLGKHCEGNNPVFKPNYNVLPTGLCEWDDDWTYKSFPFPCRCESAGSETSQQSYIKR